MIKKKKILIPEDLPAFRESVDNMPADSKIFVDKSIELAAFILYVIQQKGMNQKELAVKMGKTEAEVSKWLAGMHNFTLRSLAKLEAALNTSVIFVPKQAAVPTPAITTKSSLNAVAKKPEKSEAGKLQYGKVVTMGMENPELNKAI